MLPENVQQKLDSLPTQPGVYLFKDKKEVVVYVGKAKSLRSRVRSYFQAGQGDTRPFIPLLLRTIGDLDTIVTATEKEAAILENNLIKEHRPRYNVKLRDDKDFITLRLGRAGRVVRVASAPSAPVTDAPPAGPSSLGEPRRPATPAEWPRLDVVRRPRPDGGRYFGPYHSATAARRTLHLVNKHFQLRTCADTELVSRRRPCLQHQIKRCPAPCVLPVDPAFYAEQADDVARFLEGRHDELSRDLDRKMKDAARAMRFELAAVYRDQLRAIEKVREEQRVVTIDAIDRDVLGLYREGELVEIALLHVRQGKLADVTTYAIKQAEIPDDEIVAAFVSQHYAAALDADPDAGMGVLVPGEVIVPCELEAMEGVAEWLGERAGHKVALLHPRRGHRVQLIEMARDNARHAFAEKQRQSDDVQERLRDLQERLRLPAPPRRIECCDISHLGGGDCVGAVVAMTDAELDKKRYRTFRVRGGLGRAEGRGDAGTREPGNDDYASMYEVLARRFRRATAAAAEGPPSGDAAPAEPDRGDPWEAPDLFVVDGGRGQLAVALAAAHDLGLHDLPIVGLAKERESITGEAMVDRVYLPGQKNPVPLRSGTTSLFLLARLRDEAHRFSNRARMAIGKKRRFASPLDAVKGLGPKTKKALLTHIGGVTEIRLATDAALAAVPGVGRRHVQALREAFPPPAGAPLEPSGALEMPGEGAVRDAAPLPTSGSDPQPS